MSRLASLIAAALLIAVAAVPAAAQTLTGSRRGEVVPVRSLVAEHNSAVTVHGMPAQAAPAAVVAAGIDFTRPLHGIDGKPILNPDKTPLTIGSVAANCLVQEPNKTGQGPALWALALKIEAAKAAVLDATEKHAIETCLADRPPIVSGQIIPLIDPADKGEPLK